MAALVQRSFVSQVVRHLPAPLLRVLDAWAARAARRRREQRLRKWQQNKAVRSEQPIEYQLKPWRD